MNGLRIQAGIIEGDPHVYIGVDAIFDPELTQAIAQLVITRAEIMAVRDISEAETPYTEIQLRPNRPEYTKISADTATKSIARLLLEEIDTRAKVYPKFRHLNDENEYQLFGD